jgi:hypothetical protein
VQHPAVAGVDQLSLVVWHGISVTYSLPVRQRA